MVSNSKRYNNKRRRTKQTRATNASRSKGDAPVSRASRPLRSNHLGATVQSGVDHVATIDTGSLETGSIIQRIQIVPSLCRRLHELAGAFQRVRYRNLHFRVEPMAGTSVTGGYAAAFIRDPSELVSLDDAITTVMAQKGAVSRKAWEGCNLHYSSAERFYTSQNSEIRTYSPGELIIVCAAKFSQPVQFVVTLNWTVELDSPGVTEDSSAEISTDATVRTGVILTSRNGHSGLWARDRKADTWSYNATNLLDYPFPDATTVDSKTVIRFRAPFNLVYQEADNSEYVFRDILCTIVDKSWCAWPLEPETPAAEYYSKNFVHNAPWLVAQDQLHVINANGSPLSDAAPGELAYDSGEVMAADMSAAPTLPKAVPSPVLSYHWRLNRPLSSQTSLAARLLLSKNLEVSQVYSRIGYQVLPNLTKPVSKPSAESQVTPAK